MHIPGPILLSTADETAAGFSATGEWTDVARTAEPAARELDAREFDALDRRSVIELLEYAARMAHARWMQYLYAGYCLNLNPTLIAGKAPYSTLAWRASLGRLAREELGHWLSLSNLLRLLGGRARFLARSEFESSTDSDAARLRSPSKNLLAALLAEKTPAQTSASLLSSAERDEIHERVQLEFGRAGLRRAGALYGSLVEAVDRLDDASFHRASSALQIVSSKWQPGANDRDDAIGVKVMTARDRRQALRALRILAGQYEGFSGNRLGSHFDRLLTMYRDFPEQAQAVVLERQELTGPGGGIIGSARNSAIWTQLFNVRYAMLCVALEHLLELPATDPSRDVLTRWVRDTTVGSVASGNVAWLDALADRRFAFAAPAREGCAKLSLFDIPAGLQLPEDEADRWRLHLALIDEAACLAAQLPSDPLLETIGAYDGGHANARRRFIIDQIAVAERCLASGAPGRSTSSASAGQPANTTVDSTAPNATSEAVRKFPRLKAVPRFPRVKQILDEAFAAYVAANGPASLPTLLGPQFSWQTRADLQSACAVMPGNYRCERLIDPVLARRGAGDETLLVVALRTGRPASSGVSAIPRMPPGGPYLSQGQIEEIVAWINCGMP